MFKQESCNSKEKHPLYSRGSLSSLCTSESETRSSTPSPPQIKGNEEDESGSSTEEEALSNDNNEMDANAEDLWMKRLVELRDFHNQRGHCKPDYLSEPTLYSWLSRQKHLFKNGRLSMDRQRMLESVGVTFHSYWDEMLLMLSQYFKSAPDPFNSPVKSDRKLSHWTWRQLHAWKKNKLAQDKIEKLRSLGLTYDMEKVMKPKRILRNSNEFEEKAKIRRKRMKSSKSDSEDSPPSALQRSKHVPPTQHPQQVPEVQAKVHPNGASAAPMHQVPPFPFPAPSPSPSPSSSPSPSPSPYQSQSQSQPETQSQQHLPSKDISLIPTSNQNNSALQLSIKAQIQPNPPTFCNVSLDQQPLPVQLNNILKSLPQSRSQQQLQPQSQPQLQSQAPLQTQSQLTESQPKVVTAASQSQSQTSHLPPKQCLTDVTNTPQAQHASRSVNTSCVTISPTNALPSPSYGVSNVIFSE